MADKNHGYATSALHYHGFLTRSDVTSRFVGWDTMSDIGRADIFAARNGYAISIECKYAPERFQFDDWRKPQRTWARNTSTPPYSVPYWIYLTMGSDPPHYNPNKYAPRRTWLMPYSELIRTESIVTQYQKSIPYRIASGMKREIQDFGLDAITQFKEYELMWASNNSLHKPLMYEYLNWHSATPNIEPMPHISTLTHDCYQNGACGGFWIIPDLHPFAKCFILDV